MHPCGFTPRHPLTDSGSGTPRHPLAAAGSATISGIPGPPSLSARGLGPGGAPFGAALLRCFQPKIEAERFPDAPPMVIFVLGGSCSGKTTHCTSIAEMFNFAHLSLDDLLRQERNRPDSEYAQLIEEHISQGKRLPGQVSMAVLKQAMQSQWKGGKFLLDDFPKNMDDLSDFRAFFGETVNQKTCLYFDVSQANLERRLLSLTASDEVEALEVIRQRVASLREEVAPALYQFQYEGILTRVDANRDLDKVWCEIQQFFIVETHKDANASEAEINTPYKAIWKLRDKQSEEMFPTSHSFTSTTYVKGSHARAFNSFTLLARHRDKHTRNLKSPTDNFFEPMTLSQEIGWHPPAAEGEPLGAKGCPAGCETPRIFHPRNTCPMTRHMENMYSTNAQHIIRRW